MQHDVFLNVNRKDFESASHKINKVKQGNKNYYKVKDITDLITVTLHVANEVSSSPLVGKKNKQL